MTFDSSLVGVALQWAGPADVGAHCIQGLGRPDGRARPALARARPRPARVHRVLGVHITAQQDEAYFRSVR
jgi:hypothetical protein